MRRFVEGMNKMKFLISIFLCLMCVLFFTISNHQTVFGIGPTAEQPEANVLVADDGQTLSIAVNSQNSINENSKKTENELSSSSSRQQRTKTSAKRKRRAVLSLTDMISIVQYHNDYRRQVGASNMQMMVSVTHIDWCQQQLPAVLIDTKFTLSFVKLSDFNCIS